MKIPVTLIGITKKIIEHDYNEVVYHRLIDTGPANIYDGEIPVAVRMETYTVPIDHIMTTGGAELKIALDEDARYLVDIYVELATTKSRNEVEKLKVSIGKLERELINMNNSWWGKLWKNL